eukprot:gene3093-3372_t
MEMLLNERAAQKSYWLEHSSQPTVEAMMLDSKASVIDQLERPEVLATLGSVKGERVLELGAGIGRFTGELAKTAKSVTACDFMEVSIAENKRQHAHLGNVSFLVADVTELTQEAGAYDVVFSNWLLMYLSDAEVQQLAAKILSWLAPGGLLFFRESCFRPSGDRPRNGNPTHYRNPRDYFAIFDKAELLSADGSSSAHLELVCCKCVDTYVTVKKNQNQICWKFQKQYSDRSIALYERVYGRGFVSPGGAEKAAEILQQLHLQPGMKVLDVGCGTGDATFDVVMCKDSLLHVEGKQELFSRLFRWLKPGGLLLVLDYCKPSSGSSSTGLEEYIGLRRYSLMTMADYQDRLSAAGFRDVDVADVTKELVQSLQSELAHVVGDKDAFERQFSGEEFEDVVTRWQAKLDRAQAGEQLWGRALARKPL